MRRLPVSSPQAAKAWGGALILKAPRFPNARRVPMCIGGREARFLGERRYQSSATDREWGRYPGRRQQSRQITHRAGA